MPARAEWIGGGFLHPRGRLRNAGRWTPQMNGEYLRAWNEQQQALQREAQAPPSPVLAERTYPQRVVDEYVRVVYEEGAILSNRGIVMGLESSRGPNEAMLRETKRVLLDLEAKHAASLERLWTMCPELLLSMGQCVFVREP